MERDADEKAAAGVAADLAHERSRYSANRDRAPLKNKGTDGSSRSPVPFALRDAWFCARRNYRSPGLPYTGGALRRYDGGHRRTPRCPRNPVPTRRDPTLIPGSSWRSRGPTEGARRPRPRGWRPGCARPVSTWSHAATRAAPTWATGSARSCSTASSSTSRSGRRCSSTWPAGPSSWTR